METRKKLISEDGKKLENPNITDLSLKLLYLPNLLEYNIIGIFFNNY